MGTKGSKQDRLSRKAAAKRQLLQRQKTESQRRATLLEHAEEMVKDFISSPASVGSWIAGLGESGALKGGDLGRLAERLQSMVPPDLLRTMLRGEAPSGATSFDPQSIAQGIRSDADRATSGPRVLGMDPERRAQTQTIVERLARGFGLAPDRMSVQVNAEAARRTDGAGASGLMADGHVFLHPDRFDPASQDGKYLLGHEMAHVAQRELGESAPGGTVIHMAEAEAARIGDRFARGAGVERPVYGLGALARAADTGATSGRNTQANETPAAEQSGAPSDFTLTIGERTVVLEMPADAEAGLIELTCTETPLPGLTITGVALEFDEDWNLLNGEATASLTFGDPTPFVSVESVQIAITSEGALSATLEDIAFTVGEIVNGSISLTIGSEGLSGTATLGPEEINLAEGLVITEGAVTATLDVEGALTLSGAVTCVVEGLGTIVVNVAYAEGAITGSTTLTLEQPIEVSPGLSIGAVTATGTFLREGFTLEGSAAVTLGEVYAGEITGTWSHPSRTWSLEGALVQTGEMVLGDITVESSSVDILVVDGAVSSIAAIATFSTDGFSGALAGTWDGAQNQLSGSGTGRMTAPMPFGDTGAVLEEAEGRFEIEANVLTTITASGRATLPYQDQPTFDITLNEAVIRVPEGEISGAVSVTTTRDVVIGDAAGTHAVIAEGAQADGTLDANKITELSSGLAFRVTEPDGDIGEGTIALSWGASDGAVSGTGTFTVTEDYGWPDRAAGPIFIGSGATITVELADSALSQAVLSETAFVVVNPTGDGQGRIEGTAEGTWDIAGGTLNATAAMQVATDWPITADWGELTLISGGSITATVTDNDLSELTGAFPYRASVTVEGLEAPVAFEGELNGSYVAADNTVEGALTGTLTSDVTVPVGEAGTDHIVFLAGSTARADVTGSTLQTITMDVNAELHREGALFATGQVTDATWNLETGQVSFEGVLTLQTEVTKATDDGRWTFALMPESQVTVTVVNDVLERIGGTVLFEVRDAEGAFLEGSLTDAEIILANLDISGTLDVHTAREFIFPKPETSQDEAVTRYGLEFVIPQGAGVVGQLSHNVLEEVTASLDLKMNWLGVETGNGTFEGQWKVAEELFTGTANFTLVQDFMLAGEDREGSDGAGGPATWLMVISEGSGFDVQMTDNVLERAHIGVDGKLVHNEIVVATGTFSGDYKLGDDAEGFSGELDVQVISRIDWSTGERFHYFVDTGSTLHATAEQSKLTAAEGTLIVVAQERGADAIRTTAQGTWSAEVGLDATGTVEVLQNIALGESDEFDVYLAQGSSGNATIAAGELTEIGGTLTFIVDREGVPFARGEFEATYVVADGDQAMINAEGTVELLAEFDATPEGAGEYKFIVESGTGVRLKITDNALDWIEGGLVTRVEDGEGAFATVAFDGRFEAGEQPALSGTGTAEITRDKMLFESDEYRLFLEPGAGATFTVERSVLTQVEGELPIRLDDSEGGLVRGALQGSWAPGDIGFEGSGTVELLRQVAVIESAPGTGYGLYLEPATSITATVSGTRLTELTGTLVATVHDGDGEFLRATAEATYNGSAEPATITANGSLEITREKELLTNQAGYAIALEVGSGATIALTDNNLEELGGTLSVRADREGVPLARVALSGTYRPDGGFVGTGEAELLDEVLIGSVGIWTAYAEPGTGVTLTMEASEITTIAGTVSTRIDEGEIQFVRIAANATYDVAAGLITGTGEATVLTDRELVEIDGFTLFLCEGSGITATVTENDLERVAGALSLRVDEAGEPLGRGQISGEWLVQQGMFSGTGDFGLVRDFELTGVGQVPDSPLLETWTLAIKQGSNVTVSVADNVFQEATISVQAGLNHNTVEVANGSIDGQYTLGSDEGFTGTAVMDVTSRVAWSESGRFQTFIGEGTHFDATVTASQVTAANGTFILFAQENGQDALSVSVEAAYAQGVGVSGDGTVTVLQPILLGRHEEYSVWLDVGSGGDANVTANELTRVHGTLKLRLDKDDTAFATGDFEATYEVADGENARITASGSIELIGELDITPTGFEDYKLWLTGGSGVGVQITDNQLDWLEGQVNLRLDDAGGAFMNGQVGGRYEHINGQNLTANGSVEVTRVKDTGVEYEGYKLLLDVGTGAEVQITASELDTLSATVNLLIRDPATVDLWKIQLSGTYTHASQEFTGSGSAELLAQMAIAENVGESGYSFYMEPGTGVSVTVTANELTDATGTLNVSVHDGDGEFLTASGEATYTNAQGGQLTRASATLEITREKEMLSTANGYSAWLEATSGAHIEIVDTTVTELSGTINMRLDNGDGAFAKVGLTGNYTPAGGFTGEGSAELLQEYQVIVVGEYTLYALPGTGANITIVASDITHISATVNARIDDAEGEFISVVATADYDFPGAIFNGSGAATVLRDKKLATIAGEELWLCEGSGASAVVMENVLQSVSGNLTLRMEDTEGAYMTVALAGSFDAAGGTGFTGTGAVTISRDKKLAQLGTYSFWLAAGAGATATINENALEQVTGNVPFKVYDAEPEPLIVGQAEGTYTAATQMFTGSGDVRLGRDVTFDLGGGTELVFMEGSGGSGSVENNELHRLGGTLNLQINTTEGPLVRVTGEGEYDAVNNVLIRASGTAEMLRPFELLGGQVRVEELSGSAVIENNELVEVHGAGSVVIVPLNNMRGTFDLNWENRGAGDVFWGSGEIDFTLFDDPSKGRSMSGMVGVTYNRDDTFLITGEVDYQMNEMIGGTIGVEVAEDLDPVLSGQLRVRNVPLARGRDLFGMTYELPALRTTVAAGPVPIAISAGASLGMKLAMDDLTLSVDVDVENFRPSEGKVPNFRARADLETGLTLTAALIPFIQAGIGVAGGASIGARLQGELAVTARAGLNPFAILTGNSEGYEAELGLGVNISVGAALALTPQIYAELGPKTFPYDLTEWNLDLGEIFSYDWSASYTFGDNGSRAGSGSAARPSAMSPAGASQASTGASARDSGRVAGYAQTRKPGALDGGPDIGAAEDRGPEVGSGGPMGELQTKIDYVQDFAGKFAHIAEVGGNLMTVFVVLGSVPPPFNIFAAGLYLGYMHVTGEMTFGDIQQAFLDAWSIIEELDILGLLAGLLPDWLVDAWNAIKDKGIDGVLIDLVDGGRDWLKGQFPSWGRVVDAVADGIIGGIAALSNLIGDLFSGNLSLSSFLELAAALGEGVGRILLAVAEELGEAALEMLGDAAAAVGAAASWVADGVGSALSAIGDAAAAAAGAVGDAACAVGSFLNPFD